MLKEIKILHAYYISNEGACENVTYNKTLSIGGKLFLLLRSEKKFVDILVREYWHDEKLSEQERRLSHQMFGIISIKNRNVSFLSPKTLLVISV